MSYDPEPVEPVVAPEEDAPQAEPSADEAPTEAAQPQSLQDGVEIR